MNRKKILKRMLALVLAIIMMAAMPAEAFAGASDSGMDTYSGKLPELQNAIAAQAIRCAWPYGGYRNYANDAYSEALNKAYGSRSGWGAKTKAGRSCDVFVGTVIRSCGYDTSFPRGLEQDRTYLPASDKFKKINVTRAADMEPGDVIFYVNKGRGGHICVYVEIDNKGYIAEASFSLGRVGRIARRAPDWHPSNFKVFGVYRPCKDCTTSYAKGDSSKEVKKIQNFLKWAGFFRGNVDGVYGSGTEKAVKKFQKAAGVKVTGTFGSESLKAARTYDNDKAGAYKAK